MKKINWLLVESFETFEEKESEYFSYIKKGTYESKPIKLFGHTISKGTKCLNDYIQGHDKYLVSEFNEPNYKICNNKVIRKACIIVNFRNSREELYFNSNEEMYECIKTITSLNPYLYGSN